MTDALKRKYPNLPVGTHDITVTRLRQFRMRYKDAVLLEVTFIAPDATEQSVVFVAGRYYGGFDHFARELRSMRFSHDRDDALDICSLVQERTTLRPGEEYLIGDCEAAVSLPMKLEVVEKRTRTLNTLVHAFFFSKR